MDVEPLEQTRSWAQARARELVATRLARHPGDATASSTHWCDLLEETLDTAGPAHLACLVSELCDLGVEGLEAEAWLPPRKRRLGVPTDDQLCSREEPAAAAPEPRVAARRRAPAALVTARRVALAVGAAIVVRALLLQVYYVPSGSMAPTLAPGDRIAVEKMSVRFDDPDRGDVVVFRAPAGQRHAVLVKRVVATGGDVVAAADGRLLVNDEVVEEPYLASGTLTADFGPVTVPADHLFVLGDSRLDSRDSRSFGTVPKGAIIGRPALRIWPLSDIGGV